MCHLQNIAMYDYQESVTTGQTDGRTDRHRTKWSLCAAMLRRWHKNKLWIRSPTHQTFTLDPTSDKSQGGGGGGVQTHYLCFRWKLMLNSIETKICGVCCKGQSNRVSTVKQFQQLWRNLAYSFKISIVFTYSLWYYLYSKARILRTRIIRIHAYSEVISIPRQKPFKMIRKNEG